MWRSREDTGQTVAQSRVPAELSVIDESAIASAIPSPAVANLNISKSSKVHIGPKFVSVTQNVQNAETLKGRFLGLELVSTKQARRLRCSVAVFVCWALVVASALVIYLVYVALPNQQFRLDIELPLPKYLWQVIKNSSRTERLSCAAALIVLIVCVALIAYFSVMTSKTKEEDRAPHEWRITREMWLARPYNYTYYTYDFEPLLLVVIQNTVGPQCHRFQACAAELRNLQGWFINDMGYDIPYNFAVGNDGRVYENRGWSVEGAHTRGYNRCSMGIGFLGDYRGEMENHAVVTPEQENRTQLILAEGVKLGYLRRDFLVVGAKDISDSASPGSNLYNAIRRWPNYDHQNRFKGLSCEQIHEKYKDTPLYEVPKDI
ncbi:uncharacterized protein LOC116777349 isoform X3 [Danaus plexippus]|uniref:uncharacterized protein LOC116777349 isoform X3 n=1 Tax=Danaus plexippus TaxID=13037 RepID=UPI002AB28E8F|nr:uncharacterized protein LOC116777349 isoform X3 [Danaus plexippus]